jgi:phospholipase/carboxylesterase
MNTTAYTLGALQTEPSTGLAYRLRQPAPAQPTQLLVLLHGVGGNESNLLDLATGTDPHTLVVLVRGPLAMGPAQFAWFSVNFSADGPQINPQQAERSRTLLIALLRQLQQQHGIATRQTVIAGFSQGGIMSASVALSSPESVRAFALLSGRILPELEPHIASAERLAGLRALIAHGEEDTTLPVVWAERAHALLTRLGVPHRLRRYPMAHTISAGCHADFVAWLADLGR